jgi:HK97 family phage prohead protease
MSVRYSRDDAIEHRMALEARVDLSDDRKIRGVAIVFNSTSVDLGGFREIIKPEAVDRTLREALDVRALVDHDTGKVIGRTTAGTLVLKKDRSGLKVVIDPPNTTVGRDIVESVQRGDVTGMSFGFRVLTDEWRMENGEAIREVLDMVVYEASIVAFPAYQATHVSMASQRALSVFRSQMEKRDSLARVRALR